MPQFYIGNTDNDWFDFLKARQPFEEINFWKPSQQLFRAVDEGELFLFRLKSPRGKIGGFGTLVSSINVPLQLAWDSLGEANGVANIDQMIKSIAKYRPSRETGAHTLIGCRVLANPVFFEEHEWLDVPDDWALNIVSGKVYNTDNIHGKKLFHAIEARLSVTEMFRRDRREFDGFGEPVQAAYGSPILTKSRLGQASFRMRIANVYDFECAISGTRVMPALEAAHIVPFSKGGSHSIENGIFLRKDIHSVFDSGFATFDEDFKFRVSSRVKTIFNNGSEYRKLNGVIIRVPNVPDNWPSKEALKWHRENCYVGD